MKTTNDHTATHPVNNGDRSLANKSERKSKPRQRFISRRAFLGKSLAVGAGTIGAGLLANARAEEDDPQGSNTAETRHCSGSQRLQKYSRPTFGSNTTNSAASKTDEVPGAVAMKPTPTPWRCWRMTWPDYIHDNTDDEITHHQFLNAYLVSKGAAPANLDPFRTLMGSTATGVNPALIGQRLTNLTQLTIDTSWWTRYRDDSHNPDLDPNHVFPQAVPTLAVNQHTAIPRTDADTTDPNFLQAIANTAAFHFPTIEQGGNSLYPSLAQRATSVEVLRILISIGPTETMHFQTWSDKAGNAPPLTAVDPVTGVSVTFPDLEVEDELFDKALIMPEPCPFLDRNLPIVSIIRPTKTHGVAMGALQFLTSMGLFIGQSPAFFCVS